LRFASASDSNQTLFLLAIFFAQSHFGEWYLLLDLLAMNLPGIYFFLTSLTLYTGSFGFFSGFKV